MPDTASGLRVRLETEANEPFSAPDTGALFAGIEEIGGAVTGTATSAGADHCSDQRTELKDLLLFSSNRTPALRDTLGLQISPGYAFSSAASMIGVWVTLSLGPDAFGPAQLRAHQVFDGINHHAGADRNQKDVVGHANIAIARGR